MKAAAAGIGLWLASVAWDAGAADHQVLIEGMSFTPKVLIARPGDTVTWVNRDIFVHNVTAAAAGVRSGDLQPGRSWRHVLRQGERFDYLCTLHPVMSGRVEVKGETKPARRRSTS